MAGFSLVYTPPMVRWAGAMVAWALWMTAAAAQDSSVELSSGDAGWVVTREPEPGSDEALMVRARELMALGKGGEARRLLTAWIEANKRTDNKWLSTAYLLRGDAILLTGDEHKALYDYEVVIKDFPQTEQFVTAIERELDIAVRYVNGLKRRWLGARIADATGVGEEILIRVQERLPRSTLAERAGIELADYYYRVRDLEMASEAYGTFLKLYTQSEYRRRALERQVYVNIARFKGPKYDAAGLIEAKLLAEDYAERYPLDAQRTLLADSVPARIDESQAAQMLETARWYVKRGDEPSAVYTLERLLEKHPGSLASVNALALLHKLGWEPTAPPPAASEPVKTPAEAGQSPPPPAPPGDAKAGAP